MSILSIYIKCLVHLHLLQISKKYKIMDNGMDNTEDVESEDDFDYYYNSDPYDYDDNESPEVNEGTDKDEESNIELEEEKEIEFARKNYAKAVDGMQVALETEAKAKVELSRIKKKLEADVLDLSHLEHANASNTEAQKNIKQAKRAMCDTARMANELRCEQDAAMTLERDNKLLEAQCKDVQIRCDEAEQNALKGGKKAITTMESRIRELESELNAENRRFTDAQNNLRKTERHVKELTYTQEEDKKNHERMQGMSDNLQASLSVEARARSTSAAP